MENNNYLIHYGVVGMKWGVRRYQNPDGTLTDAGRKKYYRMSGDKLHRTLKKQYRDERQRQYPGGNRWAHDLEIGPKSKAIRDTYKKEFSEFINSKEWKDYEKKADSLEKRLNKKFDKGEISTEEYVQKINEIFESRPRANYTNDLGFAIIYNNGKHYTNDFINKGGKNLSIARLEDLGYARDDAVYFVEKMIKSGKTLGDI